RGTIKASTTGFKLISASSIDGLRIRDITLHGGASTGQTGGSSLNGNLDFTECNDLLVQDVKSTNSLFVGLRAVGCNDIRVIGGDYSTNVAPVHFLGCKRGKMQNFTVKGSILTPEIFKT